MRLTSHLSALLLRLGLVLLVMSSMCPLVIAQIDTISYFERIEVGGTVQLYLSMDSTYSVDYDLLAGDRSKLRIYTEDETLHIKLKRERSRQGRTKVKVYASFPTLDYLKVYSDAKAYCIDTLQLDDLTVAISQGASAELLLATDYTTLSAGVRSSATIEGRSKKASISSHLSSTIEAKDFVVDRLKVTASKAGQAIVTANDKIQINVSESGVVEYYGDAEIRSSGEDSSGRIIDKEPPVDPEK